MCPEPHRRGPRAVELAVRSAYMWYRHKGRRAWRRTYPALIAAGLIVACDRWPDWLA